MNEREKIIRLWFDMWIKKADLGIDNIFTDDVVYTESWSPKYENRKTVKHWFDEWNTRGSVLVWEIKQFFHQGNQTIVEWYFKSKMNNGNVEEFDGISLIDFIVEKYREQYAILQVGTGDSPLTIPFYEKCGFVRSHIIPNFFTDNYDHPIYEDGVQLVDMVYLQRQL